MNVWAAAGVASLICLPVWGPSVRAGPGPATAGVPDPATAGVPGPATAREAGRSSPLPAGVPIARLELEPLGIFEPAPDSPLGSFYRLADRLHIRTRTATIRRHLLLDVGEPWNEERARESERALRALDIFSTVRVDGRALGDSAVVSVRTRDAWTTSPEVTIEGGGGELYGSAQFSERNLFGTARSVGVGYREEPAGISRWIEAADPALAGTRMRFAASATDGTRGVRNAIILERPFYAENTRSAYGIRAERVAEAARLYESGTEAARFPREVRSVEVYAGWGRRSGHLVSRLTGRFVARDRFLGASTPVPGAPTEFAGGDERTRLRRLVVEGLVWRPRFIERTLVDRLDGIEDIDLGPRLELACGVSPRALGGSADEGYAAVRFRAGTERGAAGFGWLGLEGDTRLRAGLREAHGRAEARWVQQGVPRHTLVVAALGARAYRPSRDVQLVLGGLNGLRAHDVYALTGDRLWRLNAESRWLVGRELLQLVSLGAAAFWDAGRAYGPGSGGQPWQHDVGVGLRVALPRSALNRVARFDVAWRVSPGGPGAGEPVFSFSSQQAF